MRVDTEDSFSPAKTSETWQKLYRKLGVSDEQVQLSVRAGVYVYLLANGASRVGNYKGEIQTSTGLTFSASMIPHVAGVMEVRRFMRGNLTESYLVLKAINIPEVLRKLTSKCATIGIGASDVFAVADWMDNCPEFTPSETAAHEKYRNFCLQRARGARGGKSLEEVEEVNLERNLHAQGPGEQVGRSVDL